MRARVCVPAVLIMCRSATHGCDEVVQHTAGPPNHADHTEFAWFGYVIVVLVCTSSECDVVIWPRVHAVIVGCALWQLSVGVHSVVVSG